MDLISPLYDKEILLQLQPGVFVNLIADFIILKFQIFVCCCCFLGWIFSSCFV